MLAFALFALPSRDCFPNKGVVPQEIANHFNPPETPLSKLRSQFETSSVSFSQDSFSFFGLKRVSHLFQFDRVECSSVLNYPVTFDFTYIVPLDLGFLDISFINPIGDEVIASETVYVYPYEYGSNYRDIEFCLNDEKFRATDYFADPLLMKGEYVHEVAKLSAHSIVSQAIFVETVSGISFSYGDGSGSQSYIETTNTGYMDEHTGGIVYPTIAIAQILTSFDNAVGFAENKFPAPCFYPDPIPALAYRIKMDIIKRDFNNNKNLSIPYLHDPDGTLDRIHLGSQNLRNVDKEGYDPNVDDPSGFAWAEWSFGFSNMADSGCPVFALYNLLVDFGYTPSLPVLIAFFELCNADLLCGMGGGCVLREEVMQPLRSFVLGIVIPILVIDSAALCLIPIFGPALATIMVGASVSAGLIIDWFFTNQRGIGDVMDYLGLFHTEENCLTNSQSPLFSHFKNEMKPRGNGIICFWNSVDENLNIDFTHGAHFVYVSSNTLPSSEIEYSAYNVHGNSAVVTCGAADSVRMIKDYPPPSQPNQPKPWTEQQAERSMIAYYAIN